MTTTLTANDKDLLDTAIELECDLGVKVEVDAAGDLWSRASIRMSRSREHLGRVSDVDTFRAEFARRWYTGSA